MDLRLRLCPCACEFRLDRSGCCAWLLQTEALARAQEAERCGACAAGVFDSRCTKVALAPIRHRGREFRDSDYSSVRDAVRRALCAVPRWLQDRDEAAASSDEDPLELSSSAALQIQRVYRGTRVRQQGEE